jgi:hypothetical protein
MFPEKVGALSTGVPGEIYPLEKISRVIFLWVGFKHGSDFIFNFLEFLFFGIFRATVL